MLSTFMWISNLENISIVGRYQVYRLSKLNCTILKYYYYRNIYDEGYSYRVKTLRHGLLMRMGNRWTNEKGKTNGWTTKARGLRAEVGGQLPPYFFSLCLSFPFLSTRFSLRKSACWPRGAVRLPTVDAGITRPAIHPRSARVPALPTPLDTLPSSVSSTGDTRSTLNWVLLSP